jgi:S1-C subfamily serine protease
MGEFRDHKFHGQGTLTWPNGMKYVGDFRDNIRQGHGTYSAPDGSKYVGEIRDGVPNGQGIEYDSSGLAIRTGIWANGYLVREANIGPPATRPPFALSPATPPTAIRKAGSGSAFRIAKGMFITNHHVIDNCTAIAVNGSSGGRVVASDSTRDLALVSIANDQGGVAIIRTTRILLNEAVTAAGFPLDGHFTGIAITNGTISRLSGLRGDTGEVQISAPVQPGNSGGPLLDSSGNVIGVVSSKLDALKAAGQIGDIPQNVNFAVSGNTLRGFLDANGASYKRVGDNEPELAGVHIAARASAFTVLIECRR